MKHLIEVSGGKVIIRPHPGQQMALDSKARFTFVIAGTQSGKTSIEPVWLCREIDRCGDGDYLAVTATYDLFKLKFLPEMLTFFTRLGYQYAASDRVIWRGGVRIILRSANVPGGLESATVKAAVLDECGQDTFRLASWEAVLRRLSISGGRVFAGTTPYNLGWLKTQVYDRWVAGDRDYNVIQFKSTMNPEFPLTEYERAKNTLPDWKFQMFYNGEFSRPAGMIYPDFSELNIIDDTFELSPHWPRYMGVDFGAVNTAKLWAAYNPDTECLYVYRESLNGDKTTAEHVEEARRYEQISGAWGGAPSESQQRMDWAAAGLHVRQPPIADVEAGIDRVIAGLKRCKIFVFRRCVGLIDQFGTYSRETDEAGIVTEKIKDKNDYHYLDALRYLFIGVSGGSGIVSYRQI